jgi:hypothetical protein
MGQQIVKQPNGLYCLWSSVVDDFTLIDATPEDIVDEFVKHEQRRLEKRVHEIVADLERGIRPYNQFTRTFDECVATVKRLHGKDAESLRLLAPEG